MNLFHRKITSYPDNDNGKGQNRVERYEINTDWEEGYVIKEKNEPPAKENYYPNAALFRCLIEGTSLDRRMDKKDIDSKEKEQIIAKQTNPIKPSHIPFPQYSSTLPESAIKRTEKKNNFCKPVKKKKFISEKEQSRLGNIARKIFGLNNNHF